MSSWQPILCGEDAIRCQAAIDRLQISEPPADGIESSHGVARRTSLSWGRPGRALWHAYAARSLDSDEHRRALRECLDQILDSPVPMDDPSLFGGAAGVAWTMQHAGVSPTHGLGMSQEVLEDLDPELWARTKDLHQNYDLVSGIIGTAIYAMEKGIDAETRGVVEDAMEVLGDRLDRAVDLGLAHGVPGALFFLGRVLELRVAEERARALIQRCMDRLEMGRADPPPGAAYSHRVGEKTGFSRVAWCYGDLSVAVAVCKAGQVLDRDDWIQHGLSLASHAAERPYTSSGTEDCGLCHGMAGNAHVFNRLYQWSGREELRDASVSWFRRLLRTAEERPDGDFFAAFLDQDGVTVQRAHSGFLMGNAGVGLALLAGVSPIAPDWDRVLLLSPWEARA